MVFKVTYKQALYNILNLEKITSCLTVDPFLNPNTYCSQANILNYYIPDEYKEQLTNFMNKKYENPFLLLEIKLSDLPPQTPQVNNLRIGQNTKLAKIQAILLEFIGEMVFYEAEGASLFQDIVPVSNMEKEQTSSSSMFELEVHSEQAFSDLRPDILCLACLKGDENAFTYLLTVNSILEEMNEDEIALLKQPLWKIGIDLSFQKCGLDNKFRGPIPILYDMENEKNCITFDSDLMIGTCVKSITLLKKIMEIYYKKRLIICLKPGNILFINNRILLHGRSPFQAKYDGNDRFLIRSFAMWDKSKIQYALDGRMIQKIYS